MQGPRPRDDHDVRQLLQRERLQAPLLPLHGQAEGREGLHKGGDGVVHGQQGAG